MDELTTNCNVNPHDSCATITMGRKVKDEMKVLALVFALCATCTQFALADPLTLSGTGANEIDGVYAPYYLSLDGGPSEDMMCLSFNNEISEGETWNVTPTAVTGTPDEEAAWLYWDAENNPGNDINDQLAAWSLFLKRPYDGRSQHSTRRCTCKHRKRAASILLAVHDLRSAAIRTPQDTHKRLSLRRARLSHGRC